MFDALFDAEVALLLPETVCREHLGWAYIVERVAFSSQLLAKGVAFLTPQTGLVCISDGRGRIFDAISVEGVAFLTPLG